MIVVAVAMMIITANIPPLPAAIKTVSISAADMSVLLTQHQQLKMLFTWSAIYANIYAGSLLLSVVLNSATVMDGVIAIDDVTVMISSLYTLMLLLVVDTDEPWGVLTVEAACAYIKAIISALSVHNVY